MSKQLLVPREFVRGSSAFGVFFPKIKTPKPENVQSDKDSNPETEDEVEKTEPPLLELYFDDDLLVPASAEETSNFYHALKKNDAVPDNCYWFYVQDKVDDVSIFARPEHIPIYHFGLKLGAGMFFSGRKDFDWSKHGGTVYKILSY